MAEGITPQEVVDRYHPMIRDSFEGFGISFDNYSRTSREVIQIRARILSTVIGKGRFVLKREEQLYDPQAGVFLLTAS